MNENEARGLEHAWRYFALHAEQRMTVFNYFVACAGLALTGLAWVLAQGSEHWPLGVAAGVSAAGLSFVFWRLDQRGAQLVKCAEDAMADLERKLPQSSAVTNAERQLATNGAWTTLSTPWTFGRSFRLLFGVVFLLGLIGSMLTAYYGIDGKNIAKTRHDLPNSASGSQLGECGHKNFVVPIHPEVFSPNGTGTLIKSKQHTDGEARINYSGDKLQ